MAAGFDLDALLAARQADWDRLRVLATARRLAPGESDELVTRYQQASADLALVRSRAPDPDVVRALSALVARARSATVGGTGRRGWAAVSHGVLVTFPLAVYQSWRWWCATATASAVLAFAMMGYVADHPQRVGRAIPSEQIRQLVEQDFAGYYTANPAQSFAAQVWLNNALVSALGLILGITLIGTVYVLFQNIANVGLIGGVLIGAGKAGLFFGLVVPHGLLELTAVFVATGSGLRLGWAWVAPGARTRGRSLAETGRSTVVIAVGLIGVLAVSGAIEAFVTPSGLPTWARIGIGVLAEAAFLLYVFGLGRRAAAAGETADLAAAERESVTPTA